MVFRINSCTYIYIHIYIYIYIYILVTPCDGSQREVRSTPHETCTFENITTVFIDLHMLRLFFFCFFLNNSQPHANLHYNKTNTTTDNNNTHVETHVQNLHAAQAISRTPHQSVNRKMFCATIDFDPPMEI